MPLIAPPPVSLVAVSDHHHPLWSHPPSICANTADEHGISANRDVTASQPYSLMLSLLLMLLPLLLLLPPYAKWLDGQGLISPNNASAS